MARPHWQRLFSLESSGSATYHGGLRFGSWEMSAYGCDAMIIRNREVRRRLRWVLVGLIVCAAATSTGQAQLRDRPKSEAWKYKAKRSWKYKPKQSWKYHPTRSWKYHPTQFEKYRPKQSWKYHPKQQLEYVRRLDTQEHAYRIACTHPLIAELVEQLTGDRALVEAVALDISKLQTGFVPHSLRADMSFHNGLDAQGWSEGTLEKFCRAKPIYAVTKTMSPAQLIELPGDEGRHDPHVWLDISTWRKFAELAARKVSEFDSADPSYYLANYKRYAGELDQLDAYAQRVLATIPQESRVLITDSPALGYLVRQYGIEIRALTQLQEDLRTADGIIEFLADRDITTIFSDNPGSSRWINALIERADNAGHELKLGEPLLLDVAGAPGSYEGSYIGMMDHNVTTIARALGGSAPAGGMRGTLQQPTTRNEPAGARGAVQATPPF